MGSKIILQNKYISKLFLKINIENYSPKLDSIKKTQNYSPKLLSKLINPKLQFFIIFYIFCLWLMVIFILTYSPLPSAGLANIII